MSLSVTVRGATLTIPEDQDENYGVYATAFLSAVATYINTSVVTDGTRIARVDYTTSNAAVTQSLLFGSDGDGTDGDDSAGIVCVNGELFYKEKGGNKIAIDVTVSANVNLSNLDPTTAVNEDIDPEADNTIDLGNDTNEYKDIYVHGIKHGDGVDPALSIETTSDNGNITITPHGTGDVIIKTSLEFNNGSIRENTNDLTIQSSAIGKDVKITAAQDVDITATAGDVNITTGSGNPITVNTYNVSHNVSIQDYTVVGNIGDASQQLAGHTLGAEDEDRIGAAIAIFNLIDNTDASGNSNTLDNADAINAATGILGVATTAHLGVNNEHLQADAVSGFSGTGDLDLTISGWHNPLVSSGLLAVGSNAATQKMQYYTDANGYVVFDIAGVTRTSSTYVIGAWHHICFVYDKTNSVAYGYIDGVNEVTISATSNLDIQASPSIWINSKTDGTLEVASYHDEIYIREGILDPRDVEFLFSTAIIEPAALTGKTYRVLEYVRPEADTNYEYQGEANVLTKYNSKIWLSGRSYGETDSVKLIGEVK